MNKNNYDYLTSKVILDITYGYTEGSFFVK